MYAAYYILDRLEEIPEYCVYLKKCKQFLEGAINLIKKKYYDGTGQIAGLIEDYEGLHESIVPLLYSYRAYGRYCQGEIEQALEDYAFLEKKEKEQTRKPGLKWEMNKGD